METKDRFPHETSPEGENPVREEMVIGGLKVELVPGVLRTQDFMVVKGAKVLYGVCIHSTEASIVSHIRNGFEYYVPLDAVSPENRKETFRSIMEQEIDLMLTRIEVLMEALQNT
jgi:hypothetical protein